MSKCESLERGSLDIVESGWSDKPTLSLDNNV